MLNFLLKYTQLHEKKFFLAKMLLFIWLCLGALITHGAIEENPGRSKSSLKLELSDAADFQSSRGLEPFQAVLDSPVESITIRPQHAEADEIARILEKKQTGEGLLSKEGSIAIDKTTNTLWISDSGEKLKGIQRFIQKIDIPVKQIIIQAHIVNVDQLFARELGLDFSGQGAGGVSSVKPAKILPAFAFQKNRLNVAFAQLGQGVSLEFELAALEQQGRGRILSSPRLITSSGKPAYIGSGDDIPYQEKTSHGNTSTAFKKAVLSLEVTPQWLSKNALLLNLTVHQDKVSALVVNGVPAIHTQEVRTQVRVLDGQTIVLGGIFEQTLHKQWAKIPLLGDLPLIGKLLQHQVKKLDRRELLIFITPKVRASGG